MPYKDPEAERACKKKYNAECYRDAEFIARRRAYESVTREHRREVQRQYRIVHAEALKAKLVSNAVERAQKRKAWYSKNREHVAAYMKANRAVINDNYRKWAPEYYKQHPEQRAKRAKWKAENKDRIKASQAAWRKKNHGKVLAMARAAKARRKLRIEAQGSPSITAFYTFVRSKPKIACYYCGTIIRGTDAHIDHVIALASGGNHASENLCASCETCNRKKHTKRPSELKFLVQPLLDL